MKASLIGLLLVMGIAAGCGHTITVGIDNHPGQWVLVSYSAEKGYVFSKDGVQYEAHCAGFISADAISKLPPGFIFDANPVVQEGICSAVLPYLHKQAPVKQERPFGGNELALSRAADGSFKEGAWEFVITEAK
jgi:hypothetical protein